MALFGRKKKKLDFDFKDYENTRGMWDRRSEESKRKDKKKNKELYIARQKLEKQRREEANKQKQKEKEEKKRKRRDDIEMLRDELIQAKEDGLLDNMSPSFLKRLTQRINARTQSKFDSMLTKAQLWFLSGFRKSYLDYKESIPKRNVGIKSYKLADLSPKFQREYKMRMEASLNLIKSQNDENMLKMRRRLLDWVTMSDVRDKTDLKDAIELPNNKRTRFILRDQENKLCSAMDDIVADSYNAIAFRWMTRNDDRVAGKPGGRYPKANDDSNMHGDHWSRRGKFYYYSRIDEVTKARLKLDEFAGSDKDLKDGMPGEPVGCRCWAENYYDLDDLPDDLVFY